MSALDQVFPKQHLRGSCIVVQAETACPKSGIFAETFRLIPQKLAELWLKFCKRCNWGGEAARSILNSIGIEGP